MVHLKDDQNKDLKVLLNKRNNFFGVILGVYPHNTFNVEIDTEAVPVHSRSYPVPHIILDTFNYETQHLVQL